MAGPSDNMPGVVWINWYATVFRHESFALSVAEIAPLALRYGATKYAVYRSLDDRYRITQMTWFERKGDWYRYWDGPEMIAFRRNHVGRFQIPVVYVWQDEIVTGELGPQVPEGSVPEPTPVQPTAAA